MLTWAFLKENVHTGLNLIRPLPMFYFNVAKTNVSVALLIDNVLNVEQQLDKAYVTDHTSKQ